MKERRVILTYILTELLLRIFPASPGKLLFVLFSIDQPIQLSAWLVDPRWVYSYVIDYDDDDISDPIVCFKDAGDINNDDADYIRTRDSAGKCVWQGTNLLNNVSSGDPMESPPFWLIFWDQNCIINESSELLMKYVGSSGYENILIFSIGK